MTNRGYERVARKPVHVAWSTVGLVRGIGWARNREDGGPEGIAVDVRFGGERRNRVVFLDADDVDAILDAVIENAPRKPRSDA